MMTRYYQVAGHVLAVSGGDETFALMDNYEPFTCDGGEAVLLMTIGNGEAPDYTEELRQEENGQQIACGKTADSLPVFEFRWGSEVAGWLVCAPDYREGRLIVTGSHTQRLINNALMVLFALATARRKTVLFHASAVSHEGRAYLFLGKSGTGKSTHARLWLQHIGGTELMNDDNPVIRLGDDGTAMVYGSPWSGKTPCYRNVSCPLGGIVLLSQAPYNKIWRLDGVEAYTALVASISGKRWDKGIADGLHETENVLASHVQTWHLECLPDAAAARVCSEALGVKPTKDYNYIIKEAIRLVEDGVSVTLPVDGWSMLPFIIGGRESVILQKPLEPKVGKVVLAWVEGRRYVIHRIISIQGEKVVLMGDGNLKGREHCTVGDIKALVTHVVGADRRPYDLYSRWRCLAAKAWWHLRPVRKYLLVIYRKVKKVKK